MDWLVPAVTVAVAFAGSYLGVRVTMARLEVRVGNLEREVGDHTTGLRGRVHLHRGQIGVLAGHIDELREKTGMRPLDLAESFRRDGD